MSDGQDSRRSVVITGVGMLSPIGIGAETFTESLLEGRSGIRPFELFQSNVLPQHICGEVTDFDEKAMRQYVPKKDRKSVKVMCREIQLGVASAFLALQHAKIEDGEIDPVRFGIEFGANLMFSPPEVLAEAAVVCWDKENQSFDFDKWGQTGLSRMEPLWLLKYLPNMPACHIGIFYDLRGPSNSQTMDEASGNLVLGEAVRIIERGAADAMLVGATGTRVHPVKTVHAAMWDVVAQADDPQKACRPFDKGHCGQVVAEAACSFVVESEEQARARGANILGRILGTGAACVTDRDLHGDSRRALVLAMQKALRAADVKPGDIGHINAHGTGVPEVDCEEAAAIREVFGNAGESVPVTAMKSFFGNPGASCGTLEAAGSLLTLQQGVIPQTLNFESPAPGCELNVVADKPAAISNKLFLNIDVTRQGQASAAVIQAG